MIVQLGICAPSSVRVAVVAGSTELTLRLSSLEPSFKSRRTLSIAVKTREVGVLKRQLNPANSRLVALKLDRNFVVGFLVSEGGLEPPRPYGH